MFTIIQFQKSNFCPKIPNLNFHFNYIQWNIELFSSFLLIFAYKMCVSNPVENSTFVKLCYHNVRSVQNMLTAAHSVKSPILVQKLFLQWIFWYQTHHNLNEWNQKSIQKRFFTLSGKKSRFFNKTKYPKG